MSGRSIFFGFILLFGFFARAATYRAPLLDHHSWRQADTASIARNFVRERFNILYPQVDQRGGQRDGYVETGLEAFAFIVAILSVFGGFHTETGRLLAAVCFLGSCVLVRAFVRRRHGEDAGLSAAFLYAFGFPLLLFIERAFMNEALLILLSLYAIVAAERYVARRKAGDLLGLLAASTLVAMIKLPYLIVWAPIAGLFVERDGTRAVSRWELWLMAVVNLGAAALWYTHAHALGAQTGLSFGMTDKLFDRGVVFSVAFPSLILSRLVRDILGPLGVLAVAVGGWLAFGRRQWCEVFGLFGFVAYVILVATGNLVHDYYQLAVIPVAALLAGPGLLAVAGWLANRLSRAPVDLLAALLGLAALTTCVRLVSAHNWFDYAARDLVLCDTLGTLSEPGDRLLFVGDNNPTLLVCADRKGWALTVPESDAVHVQASIDGGARLAVLDRQGTPPEVRERLAAAGTLAFADPTVEVFRLR